MKRRIISALATSLMVLTLITSTTGVTLASIDDGSQLTPTQSPKAPGKPGNDTSGKPGTPSRPAVPDVPAGSGFTYQGSLKDGTNPANGQYDLQFTLYDALTGGNQVGSPLAVSNQTVTDGLFAVQLDFGASSFQGSGRWLQIAVRPAGGGNFTTLTPRQPLTAAPYAMSLVAGAVITGSVTGATLTGNNSGFGTGLSGIGSIGDGVRGFSDNGSGGNFSSNHGFGVLASSDAVAGVFSSNTGYSLWGISNGPATALLQNSAGNAVFAQSDQSSAIVGVAEYTDTVGVAGTNYLGYGVTGVGRTGVSGIGVSGEGVRGASNSGFGGNFSSDYSYGVYAQSNYEAAGVFSSTTSYGVVGRSAGSFGGYFTSGSSDAVYGQSNSAVAGYFTSGSADAVQGHANGTNVSGVAGFNSGAGPGTYGTSGTGPGLSGLSNTGNGVTGQSTSGKGVYGESDSGIGVVGQSTVSVGGLFDGAATSLIGEDPTYHCNTCWAGYFAYNVNVNGTLYANAKSFKIDDPQDPANKYLIHTSVESPDMLNIYRGHVVLDAQGSAWVQMPDYFQALNMDFDYQLTAIGRAQPNLYVGQEIKDNRFQIAGGAPGAKVSWQVTGVRHDPYAEAHRTPVEQQKSPEEKGLYLHPELYNQPASKAISTIYQQDNANQPSSTTIGNK